MEGSGAVGENIFGIEAGASAGAFDAEVLRFNARGIEDDVTVDDAGVERAGWRIRGADGDEQTGGAEGCGGVARGEFERAGDREGIVVGVKDFESTGEVSGIDSSSPAGLKLGGRGPGGDPGGEPGLDVLDLKIYFVRPGAAGGELTGEIELRGNGGVVLPDEGTVGAAGEGEMFDDGGAALVVGDDEGGVVDIEGGEGGNVVGLGGGLLGVVAATGAGEKLGDFKEIPTAGGVLENLEVGVLEVDVVDVEDTENNAWKPGVIDFKNGNLKESFVGKGQGDGDIIEGGVTEDAGGEGFGGEAQAELFFDDGDDEISGEIGGEDDFGCDEDQDEKSGEGDKDFAPEPAGRRG